MYAELRRGDFVRLRSGKTAMRVLDVSPGSVLCIYRNGDEDFPRSRNGFGWRSRAAVVHWDPEDPRCQHSHFSEAITHQQYTEQKMSTSKSSRAAQTLYSWDEGGQTRYGYRLAVNAAGDWVMDPKGGGAPVAMPRDALSKVVPYMVDTRSVGQNTIRRWRAKEGVFAVGDLIVVDGSYGGLLRVVKVGAGDTERPVVGHLRGTRINGEAVGEPAEDDDLCDEDADGLD